MLELIAAARDFEAERVMELDEGDRDAFTDLDLFLQHVALVTDLDFHDASADAVTLMTLHSAKGLEFPVVFIGGMEEGLFPLLRAYDEPRTLEEERRLFYVGITRAMEKLYLTHARAAAEGGGHRLRAALHVRTRDRRRRGARDHRSRRGILDRSCADRRRIR